VARSLLHQESPLKLSNSYLICSEAYDSLCLPLGATLSVLSLPFSAFDPSSFMLLPPFSFYFFLTSSPANFLSNSNCSSLLNNFLAVSMDSMRSYMKELAIDILGPKMLINMAAIYRFCKGSYSLLCD
jgi:hypothetical protein